MIKKPVLLIIIAITFLFSSNCSDEPEEDKITPCSFNGPGVFGKCVVTDMLCVEFHDGGVGDEICHDVYEGSWEEGECPDSGVTGKCHIGYDAEDNYEWIEFHYGEDNSANEEACLDEDGIWCTF